MSKKIIVADIDNTLSKELKTYFVPSKVDVSYHSKGEEILTLMQIEEPVMVFLSLDLPDVNDFVVFDILKRSSEPSSSAIYILYSDNSEDTLASIRKLKFIPEGFLKKPVDKSDLTEIIKKHLNSGEYVIPSELITMKDLLDDDDIVELGTIEAEPVDEEEIDIFTEDIFVDNIPEKRENSNAGTNPEIKKVVVESVEKISEIEEPPVFDDSPFQVDDNGDSVSLEKKFQNEIKEKESEFLKEKEKLLSELNRIKERESQSNEEKKKLLREIETSELKLKEVDKEKENFKNKMESLSEDYEKKIEEMEMKYKKKLKKFEDLLKKSLTEISED